MRLFIADTASPSKTAHQVIPMAIKTVGVVGTGVIGASWTALFLSRGLKVIVSDPGAGAKEKLFQYLRNAWPVLQSAESIDSSLSRCHFVGASLGDSYKEVDFVQEVGLSIHPLRR